MLQDRLKYQKGLSEPKGKLKEGVPEMFSDIFQCAQKCGGIDMTFFGRITANSNTSARTRILKRKIHGYKFNPVTVIEMINFFGIILKISVYDNNLGGYNSYWKDNVYTRAGTSYNIKLSTHYSWAKDVMTKVRFK